MWDLYLAETLKSQNPLNVQYVKDLVMDILHENEKISHYSCAHADGWSSPRNIAGA